MTGGELISFVCTAVLKFVIREELTPATRTRGMTAYGRTVAVNEKRKRCRGDAACTDLTRFYFQLTRPSTTTLSQLSQVSSRRKPCRCGVSVARV